MRILYFTDKYGISSGYKPAYSQLLVGAGLTFGQVIPTNIYSLVDKPLIKKGNRLAWGFNPDKKHEILQAFSSRVSQLKPSVIVVSDPALLGIFCDWDWKAATIDKLRGAVYYFQGIPVVITMPITAIHRNVSKELLKDSDGDDIDQEPYVRKSGAWILQRDWERVGRYAAGTQLKLPEFQYSVCRNLEDLKNAESFLSECKVIATDIETGCYPAQITCTGFTGLRDDGVERSYVIPFVVPKESPYSDGHGNFWHDEMEHMIAWETQRRILHNDAYKTMHNGSYDTSYFIKYRLGVKNYVFDSMYLWYALYPELQKSLDFVSSVLLDDYQYWKDDIKGVENEQMNADGIEGYWRYNALDCRSTLYCTMRLLQLLPTNPSMRVNYEAAFRRTHAGLKMSMRGIRADEERRREHRLKLMAQAEKSLAEFRYMIAEPEFNINSPPHKCALLYDLLGARPRTDKGRYITKKNQSRSAGKIPMKMVASEHPYFAAVVDKLQECMTPDKQLSNVLGVEDSNGVVTKGIKMFTHRMRTAFNPVGTGTERFASKASNFWDGTNVQNIRADYRDWMVADEGCVLLDVDYSQSDDVFIGYESQDTAKIGVIESGVDGHAVHGELFFGVPYAEIVKGKSENDPFIVHPTQGIRNLSKRVVHGTNFQMAAITLYMTMGRESMVAIARLLDFPDPHKMSQTELIHVGELLMRKYRGKYPRLTPSQWYAEVKAELKRTGKIVNAFGVSHRFLGDPNDGATQREATAYFGQSNTASNMNRVQDEIDLGFIPESFRDGPNPNAKTKPLKMDWKSHGFQFLLQIHDSFIPQIDLRHPKSLEAIDNLLTVMERPVIIHGREFYVKSEAVVGTRWSKKMVPVNRNDLHAITRVNVTTT